MLHYPIRETSMSSVFEQHTSLLQALARSGAIDEDHSESHLSAMPTLVSRTKVEDQSASRHHSIIKRDPLQHEAATTQRVQLEKAGRFVQVMDVFATKHHSSATTLQESTQADSAPRTLYPPLIRHDMLFRIPS